MIVFVIIIVFRLHLRYVVWLKCRIDMLERKIEGREPFSLVLLGRKEGKENGVVRCFPPMCHQLLLVDLPPQLTF